jgi:hypothetical protein
MRTSFLKCQSCLPTAARPDPNDYCWFYCQALLEEDLADPSHWLNYGKEASNSELPLAYQKLAEHFQKRRTVEVRRPGYAYPRLRSIPPSSVVGRARIRRGKATGRS